MSCQSSRFAHSDFIVMTTIERSVNISPKALFPGKPGKAESQRRLREATGKGHGFSGDKD